jgi:hypothetical protein
MEEQVSDENKKIAQWRRETNERKRAQAFQIDTGKIFQYLEMNFKKYEREFLTRRCGLH